jgi:hypothetical protein
MKLTAANRRRATSFLRFSCWFIPPRSLPALAALLIIQRCVGSNSLVRAKTFKRGFPAHNAGRRQR